VLAEFMPTQQEFSTKGPGSTRFISRYWVL